MKRTVASLAGLVLVGAAATFASTPTLAASAGAPPAKSSYLKERADCEAGKTAQDRATCLKEAGAAAQERKRNGLDNAGSPTQNATDRCNALPAAERIDCLARVKGSSSAHQRTTTSGSVGGGGVIKETTTTTTVGSPTIVILPGGASSAPK
jgi:hypothetical protein